MNTSTFPRHHNCSRPLKLPTLVLLRSAANAARPHRCILSLRCKILFCFAKRFHGAQNNNGAGHYGGGLMGRMLKLMGNALPSHRETFLTLMERGMSRVEVGGAEQGSLVPKLLQSFSGLGCHPETPLTPPVSPLSSLSTAPPPPSLCASFVWKCCSHLLAFNTSLRPLHGCCDMQILFCFINTVIIPLVFIPAGRGR